MGKKCTSNGQALHISVEISIYVFVCIENWKPRTNSEKDILKLYRPILPGHYSLGIFRVENYSSILFSQKLGENLGHS